MAYDLVVHKVHCPRCRRLVSAVQHKYGNRLSLACPRCGRPLWLHESGCWYYVKHAPEPETEEKTR
jgi:endogenous inhibitor of DNA gyrase (YacG/DUF329 family)